MGKKKILNEEIKRIKQLFTEERLYGNLVDSELMTEQLGKVVGKVWDDLFSIVQKTYTPAEIKSFKNTPLDSVDNVIKLIDDYPEIWATLFSKYSNMPISTYKKLLNSIDQKKINLFDRLPSGEMYIDLLPVEGNIKSNTIELWRKKIGDGKFSEYLKKADTDYIHPTSTKIASGGFEGSVKVTGENLDQVNLKDISKKMFIVTDPKVFKGLMSKKSLEALENGEMLLMADPKTGNLIPVIPEGITTEKYISKLLESGSKKGVLNWLIKQRLPDHLSPYVWRWSKIRDKWVDTMFSGPAGQKMGAASMTQGVISYVFKTAWISGLWIYGPCRLLSNTVLGTTLPSWCLPSSHIKMAKEGVLLLGKGISVILDMIVCDEIDNAYGKGQCEEFKGDIREIGQKLMDIKCDDIPWDNFGSEDNFDKRKFNQWLATQHYNMIKEIQNKYGIEDSYLAKFYDALSKNINYESSDITAASNALIDRCINEKMNAKVETKVTNGADVVMKATSSGEKAKK